MKPINKDEVREKLVSLSNFLNMHSVLPGEDALTWAADCIQSYLEGKERKLLIMPLVFVVAKGGPIQCNQVNMMTG